MAGILLATSILCFAILIYPFTITFLSLVFKKPDLKDKGKQYTYNCIITAYEDLSIAYPLINSLLNQEYKNYQITVIADKCSKKEVPFNPEYVKIVYPDKPINSKVKSILTAVKTDKKGSDFSIIFDPDNQVKKNFLSQLNLYHSYYDIVQARRTAKNLDNYVACLDAAGEYYKNYIERKAPFLIGSSATIAGSGMSIKTDLLISFLESDEVQSKISGVILGEDKMLQNFVVSKDKIIAFKDDTLVMDEKITNNAQVKRQRTRWINTYFQNVNAALRILFKGIRAKSINQIVFSFNSIFPPLFLLVLFSVLILFLDWLLVGFSLPFYLVFGGLVLFTLNFVLTLRFFNAPAKVFRALILVPVFIFYQILALFNLKDSKSDFLVTKKKKITI